MKTAMTNRVVGDRSDAQGSIEERLCPWMSDPVLRRLQPKGMPLLFGNEDLEMGESIVHTVTAGILLYGLGFHLARRAGYRVVGNLNLLYSPDDPTLYVSPDVMVVRPSRPMPAEQDSYRIGEQGPAPVLVGEVLSFRTWQQGDLSRKLIIYANVGVEEYLLADVTGEMLEQRLLLLRRQRDGSWREEQDADGGITSRLGFRVIVDADGQVRLLDAKTGKRYARPDEAQASADGWEAEVEVRQRAEERIRELEAELIRQRSSSPKQEQQPKKGKRRKKS